MDEEFGSCEHLFNDFHTEAEFFAEISSGIFTAFHPLEYYNNDWAYAHEHDRYVIIVCERHSVYENGECIYQNKRFEGKATDLFRGSASVFTVIMQERFHFSGREERDSGLQYFQAHGLWRGNHNVTFDLNDAAERAKRFSRIYQCRVSVVRAVKSYDMF